MGQRKGDDIAERFLRLAAFVLGLLQPLEQRPGGRMVSRQLARSATGAGANYEEARAAESTADFVHELRVTLKETRESRYWLRVIIEAGLLPDQTREVTPAIGETDELVAILIASCQTARRA